MAVANVRANVTSDTAGSERNLVRTMRRENDGSPPVWLMRQAGRYHSHYQGIRQTHSFEDICKTPKLACEVAMGPIEEFDFDAAILFSDILYVLEIMGVPLKFDPGPQLGFFLREPEDLKKYSDDPALVERLAFQAEAIDLTRAALPDEKALIGFVGGPLTLYLFAVEGSHKGSIDSAMRGLRDGRFQGFMDKLMPILIANIKLQAAANPDCLAVFDSAAGHLSETDFKTLYVPYLTQLFEEVKADYPDLPMIYYGKQADARHWQHLTDVPFDCLGVDENPDMTEVLADYGDRWAVQGNFYNKILTLPPEQCRPEIEKYFERMAALPMEKRKGWICGLGHGVLPTTYEQNVHDFVRLSREILGHKA